MFDRDNLSTPEALSFGTVRIVAYDDSGYSFGTGFFYNFQSKNGNVTPAILTNKHVIDEANSLDLSFHIRPWPAESSQMGTENRNIRIDLSDSAVIDHPSPEVDLCAILTGPMDHRMRDEGIELLYVCTKPQHMMDPVSESQLQGMDPVVMIGYPDGLWDSVNNMPVMRQGVTATHPRLDYEGKKDFLIDIACFPGSSGSPVFWYEHGSIVDRTQGKRGAVVNGWRLRLLGIVYASHELTASGEIKVVEIPTSKKSVPFVNFPMNLGVAMKSFRVKELELEVDRLLLSGGVGV